MILGLTALGEGRMPISIRLASSLTHASGGMLGGALTGVAAWLLLTPLRTVLPPIVAVVAVACASVAAIAFDLGLWRATARGDQVDPRWLSRFGYPRAFGAYGLLLGAAFATARPYAVVYPLFLALGAMHSLPLALVGGLLFGLGRTVPIGPASFRATAVSWILYRRPGAPATASAISLLLTVAVAYAAMATL